MLGQDNPDLLRQLRNDARWQRFFKEQRMSEIEASSENSTCQTSPASVSNAIGSCMHVRSQT